MKHLVRQIAFLLKLVLPIALGIAAMGRAVMAQNASQETTQAQPDAASNLFGAADTQTAPEEKRPMPDWATQPRSRTYKALEAMYTPEFPGLPLRQVLTTLADDLTIPVYMEEREMELLGASPDTPIALSLPPVTVRQMLKFMLDPLELAYRVDGDVLIVSSKDAVNARPRFGVYDLSHISSNAGELTTLSRVVENNIRNIDPRTWAEGVWEVQSYNGKLIVSASEVVHGEIKQLLANLAQELRGDDLEQQQPQETASTRRRSSRMPLVRGRDPFQ